MNEMESLMNLLGGKAGRLAELISTLFAIGTVLKLFNARLQSWLTEAVARVALVPEDDALMLRLLASPSYRLAGFLCDLFLRLKLPTTSSYQSMLDARGDAIQRRLRNDDSGNPPPGRSDSPRIAAVLAIVGLMLAGCASLDPAGPYRGDRTLYEADLAISSSYQLAHTFVLWEYENRQALSQWPDIRKAADNVRANAPRWIGAAIALRNAYASAPSPDKAAALTASIAEIQSAITPAAGLMTARALDPSPTATH